MIPTTMIVVMLSVVAIAATAALILYVLWLAAIEREPSPIRRVKAATSRYLAPSYFVQRIAPMLATLLFLGTLGTFKALIPFVSPFWCDAALADLDRLVFGTDPWRLTHAFIGPLGTRAIDFLYGLWFAVWALAVVYFSTLASFEAQRRFFVSFIALWVILGIGAATAFSSAGPVFLDLIDHPYASRFVIPLDDAPFAAIARDVVSTAYKTSSPGAGHGISAMPSMHVAVVALIAFAMPRRWWPLTWGYWAVIMVGSVHLGWHYASDGVFGTLGAWAIWQVARATLGSSPTRDNNGLIIARSERGIGEVRRDRAGASERPAI